jgi:hypothetical protein
MASDSTIIEQAIGAGADLPSSPSQESTDQKSGNGLVLMDIALTAYHTHAVLSYFEASTDTIVNICPVGILGLDISKPDHVAFEGMIACPRKLESAAANEYVGRMLKQFNLNSVAPGLASMGDSKGVISKVLPPTELQDTGEAIFLHPFIVLTKATQLDLDSIATALAIQARALSLVQDGADGVDASSERGSAGSETSH